MRKRFSTPRLAAFVLSTLTLSRLVACSGGDDSNLGSSGEDAGNVDGTTTNDGSTPTDASNTDGQIADGASPTIIQCGTAQCDRVAETCCVPLGVDVSELDGGVQHTPPDGGPYCKANIVNDGGLKCAVNELERSCLDSTDCPSGLACLGVFGVVDGTGVALTSCGPADEYADAQTNFHELCRNGADCADASPCISYECQGNPIGSCGSLNASSDCTAR